MRFVFRLPDVGEGIVQAEIVEYLVKVGDTVREDQPVVRVETDKAVVELPSPITGKVVEIPLDVGATARVGDALLIIESETVSSIKQIPEESFTDRVRPPLSKDSPAAGPDKEPTPVSSPPAASRVLATPHTRKLARELGVDITKITGTGPHARITDDDVKNAAAAPPVLVPKAPSAAAIQAPATAGFDFEKYGPTRRVPLKGVRKRIAEVMARSVSTIPHVTHFDEADVTDLFHVIEKQKALAESRNVKLTVLSFLVKASVAALKAFPIVNSSLDEETGELVFKEYYNIGIAADTDAGLMVPVIKNVDKKTILQIAAELQELSRKARDRTIDLEDIRGGTFSISNVGAIGGKYATPIILHPQVAILCSLRAFRKPVVRNEQVVIRTIMPLTLSFDHRVLDGAEGARFMNHVVELLEDPFRMLVETV
jgi:pyruvate dehydrogenase E2 component (dihydrolipoamide acetyltransferase)